jgi:hypothetical protein
VSGDESADLTDGEKAALRVDGTLMSIQELEDAYREAGCEWLFLIRTTGADSLMSCKGKQLLCCSPRSSLLQGQLRTAWCALVQEGPQVCGAVQCWWPEDHFGLI